MEKEKNNQKNNYEKRGVTSRQVIAIAGIALLLLLYMISLVSAILDSSATASWFRASLFATVALPILIWIYIWIYGKLTGKRTITDSPEDNSLENSSENTPADTYPTEHTPGR